MSGGTQLSPRKLKPKEEIMETQNTQVDAIAVIDALTYEIAALTRRAVIAEQRVATLEAEKAKEENK
nr:MAG TPA: hypothetical protein [Caudoviricetes sp.]